MDEIYQRVFLKDCKASCQPRIINGCTGIIRSVDTEEKEQKKKNSLQFREVSENRYDTLSASVVKSFPKRYQNSDDQQDEQNIFYKYHVKALEQSFPMMYNTI